MRAAAMWSCLILFGVSACGDRPPTPADVVGTYRADLPGRATPGRAVTLELRDGNTADMAIDYQDGIGPIIETGTWSLSPKGEVRVVLAVGGFGPVTSDVTFRWTKAALSAIAFDTVRWGGRGFTLVRE
jgi:hypothetical protein